MTANTYHASGDDGRSSDHPPAHDADPAGSNSSTPRSIPPADPDVDIDEAGSAGLQDTDDSQDGTSTVESARLEESVETEGHEAPSFDEFYREVLDLWKCSGLSKAWICDWLVTASERINEEYE
jgi:hypothetical protein